MVHPCRSGQGGIVKYDGINWTVYTPDNSELPANFVAGIAIDKNDNVWLALNEVNAYFVKINNDNWRIYTSDDLGFSPYYFYFDNLAIGTNNMLIASIWYGLSSIGSRPPYLIQYDGFNWEINDPVDENGVPLGEVKAFNTDFKGNIWVSLSYNDVILAVFNGQKWYYSETGCPKETVFTIEPDFEDNIWIGTYNGIYIVKNSIQ